MRFVLVNSEEDGGCLVNHDGHFDSELEELEKYGLYHNLTGTPIDYLEAFFDSNVLIPWQSVVHVTIDHLNSSESACPICMEPLSNMVCPRITMCAHVFCYSCILAYMDYDNEKHCKKCPLCP